MKQILFLTALFLSSMASAQNYLTITQKNGDQFSYAFSDKPVVTYTETDLVLTTEDTEIQFPLSGLQKFTFEDAPTSVQETITASATISVSNNTVTICSAKADAQVQLIAVDGKIVRTYKTDAEGNLSFSIADLATGIYVVKSESLTCKISKK